jgi:hypothetical protein
VDLTALRTVIDLRDRFGASSRASTWPPSGRGAGAAGRAIQPLQRLCNPTDQVRYGRPRGHPDVAGRRACAPRCTPRRPSRALNPETRPLVKPETAERVLQAASALGYLPNPIARGLKTNRSSSIGVLIPDLTNPLFPPIVRGIEDALLEVG